MFQMYEGNLVLDELSDSLRCLIFLFSPGAVPRRNPQKSAETPYQTKTPSKNTQQKHRTIGVNLGSFSRYFVTTALQMPPLRGLDFLVPCCYKHSVPYGTEEGYEVFNISA